MIKQKKPNHTNSLDMLWQFWISFSLQQNGQSPHLMLYIADSYVYNTNLISGIQIFIHQTITTYWPLWYTDGINLDPWFSPHASECTEPHVDDILVYLFLSSWVPSFASLSSRHISSLFSINWILSCTVEHPSIKFAMLCTRNPSRVRVQISKVFSEYVLPALLSSSTYDLFICYRDFPRDT